MYFIAPHFVMAVIIMYTVIAFYIALTSIQTLQAWISPGCKRQLGYDLALRSVIKSQAMVSNDFKCFFQNFLAAVWCGAGCLVTGANLESEPGVNNR